MKLTQPLAKVYCKEQKSALEAQRLAQEIAFAPMVFQVSRLMVKFGILEYLSNNHQGVTQAEIVEHTGLSNYAAQVLLEASLSIGTVKTKDDKYTISKAGWFLLNDPMARANMNFNHDVNYLGLFHLEEALKEEITPMLWKMTRYEGKILLKLIDRETHHTAFNIIKEFRSGVTATFYQVLAQMFGNNLKLHYDPDGEDEMLEYIVKQYRAGTL